MEVPMEVVMLQDTNTKNSGILAMNNAESSTANANSEENSGNMYVNGDRGDTEASPTQADDIVNLILDEIAELEALVFAHQRKEFASEEDELGELNNARKALENISKKLDELETIIKEKLENRENR